MGNSIRLHPEHGVAPVVTACWWCGQEKNEIAMLGAKVNKVMADLDLQEPPRCLIIDDEPCDACKTHAEDNCVIAGIPDTGKAPNGLFPRGKGLYAVVKKPAILGILDEIMNQGEAKDTMMQTVRDRGFLLLEEGLFEHILEVDQDE